MSSSLDRLKTDKPMRDLITWVVSTLTAVVALIAAALALFHPSSPRPSPPGAKAQQAAPAPGKAADPGKAPTGSAQAPGGVAIVGAVTGSDISVGSPPHDKH